MKKLALFALAALLLIAFTAPAMAATNKATFYGNVRYWNWWVHQDSDAAGSKNTVNKGDNDLVWSSDFYDNRFGIKLNEGKIKANLEVRPLNGSYYRQFWASYAFTDTVEMLFGFTWSPFFCPVTTSIYTAGGIQGNWGDMASCLRSDQVGFNLKFGFGNVKIALEPPNTSDNQAKTALSGFTATDTDTYLPRIEAHATFMLGPAHLGLFGGLNKYDAVDTNDKEETVTSYMYGLRVVVPVGPLSVRGIIWTGQNQNNYGYAWGPHKPRYASAQYINGKVEDSDALGYAAAVKYKVNDMLAVDVGYAHAKYEGYRKEEDPGSFYYVAVPITIAKGFTVQIEAGQLDLKDYTPAGGQTPGVNYDEGKESWYGLYWMINF